MSHETIYRHVYADKGMGGDLYRSLRCQRKRRKRFAGGLDRGGKILGRRPVCERPRHMEKRRQIGLWKGDTLISKHHKHAIVSLVEHKSSYAGLAKVDKKTTDFVSTDVIKRIKPISKRVQTLTYDYANEFADYAIIDRAIGSTTCFYNPYSSRRRGSNENLNGHIRQYIPKTRPLSTVTNAELTKIERPLNTRPRKHLRYKTPLKIYTRSQNRVALRA